MKRDWIIKNTPELLFWGYVKYKDMLYRDLCSKICVLKTVKNAVFPILSPRGKLTLPDRERPEFCV